MSEKN